MEQLLYVVQWLIIIWIFTCTYAIPIPRPAQHQTLDKENAEALAMLNRYGHVDSDFRTHEDHGLSAALRSYQRYHGLKRTGQLDAETKSKLASPRCGLPDVGLVTPGTSYSPRLESVRFVTVENYTNNPAYKWQHFTLPYLVRSGHDHLTQTAVYYITALALQLWCIPSRMRFVPVFDVNETRELDIVFASGNHDCSVNIEFDGQGGILAHAIWPFWYKPERGDVHLDADELLGVDFKEHKGGEKNLIQILIHEFGHSLGIMHSNEQDSIMYPHYKPGLLPGLKFDDIKAVQSLYGFQDNAEPVQQRCSLQLNRTMLEGIDAAMQGLHKEIYAFRGTELYYLHEEVEYDYVAFRLEQTVRDHFPEAPNPVHAAESFGAYTYLTQGYTVYKYNLSADQLYHLVAVTNMSAEFGYSHILPAPTSATRLVISSMDRLLFRSGSFSKVYPPHPIRSLRPVYDVRKDRRSGDVRTRLRSGDVITASFPGRVYDDAGTLHKASFNIYSHHYTREKAGGTDLISKSLSWGIKH